ncbi:DNA-damage-inducible protein D [Klebsiella pneumoniae]|uniref:RNA polymerase sigma factor n=1 Tax=Klebsiella pneumoniae TaxID=573 RepID=UPI00102EDBE3|nr:sigma factor-like helix-turn-helix DNA-binding protein [Klebsiella pneumoniae]MCQ8470165.1 sigma-70 family RNA polymerase sigma factor [Klebsiella pneumoniae]QBF23593.1 DNA-damage-inducible protein D [Klebsiella pneumoniae]HCT2470270.1 sigma-70 family RNA polymerase sigma factor [Klebsiella pneumoniae]
MVIPIKKTTKEGEPYRRRAEIERVLNELDCLMPDQLVDRLTSTHNTIPFEIFIYYLRHSEIGLAAKHLEPIFTTFYSRLEAALRMAVSDAWLDHAVAIREEITERVVEMIAKDRNSQGDKMYYWETNFNHALDSMITDVLRKLGPARETDPLINSEPLERKCEGRHEVSPEVDIAASDFINPNPSKLDDAAFRLCLAAAINGLPEDERRAVGLLLQGMQIESQDPDVMTIAKALECTDRTVRNRLSRAYKKLRLVLQEEDIS